MLGMMIKPSSLGEELVMFEDLVSARPVNRAERLLIVDFHLRRHVIMPPTMLLLTIAAGGL